MKDPDIPTPKEKHLPSRNSGAGFQGRRMLVSILTISLAVGILGWFFTRFISDYAEANERSHLLSRARSVALLLDSDDIAMLEGSPEDVKRPAHTRIREQLIRIRDISPDARFVYIMALRQEHIVFLADAEPVNSSDYSSPGDVYHEASTQLKTSFSSGEAFTEGPLEDRWGTWISAIAPILSRDGIPVAILGIDINAARWQKTIQDYQWFGMTITAMAELLVILIFGIFYQTRRTHRALQKTNQDLMESKNLFGAFMKNLPAYAFMKDKQGAYVYVNKSMDHVMKSAPEERLGLADDALFPPDIAENLKANDAAVFKTGKVFQGLETVTDRNGRLRTQLAIKFPVSIRETPEYVGGISLDLSHQLKVEKERDNLQSLLTSITDSMPSILFAVDTRLQILHWNKEAEKLTGITVEKALGKDIMVLLPGDREISHLIRTALDTSSPQSLNGRTRSAAGGTLYEDITAYPLSGDRFQGVVVRIDDVTRRVGMERMLVQSEKMVSVGGLAAGMAHEINNPLAGMMQNAQVIMKRLSADLPINASIAREAGTTMTAIQDFMTRRDIPKFLDSIHGAGTHAAKIVRNMLNFSRKNTSDKTHHNLADLLDRTLELAENDYNLKTHYDVKKIHIIRRYESLPVTVHCEAANLQQVFYNIIRNAAEAMHSNPATQAPELNLRLITVGAEAVVEIQDNGPGMNEETMKRVFEPFFTTKEPDRGTGLGLSVSYFIITQDHGGTLTVDSEAGKGTTFRIRLPLAGLPHEDRHKID